MTTHIERDGTLVRMTPAGDMTIYQVAEMKPTLLSGLREGGEIELNLSEVSEMDTAGFQLLLMLKREASRLGKPFRMVGHSHATLEVIDAYRMASYFGDPVVMTS